MLNPDIKILRDGPTKIITEVRKRDSMIDNLTRMLEEKDHKITEMAMMIDSLERYLKMYENAHAPPSHNSVLVQQKKKHSACTITSNGTTDTTNRMHVVN